MKKVVLHSGGCDSLACMLDCIEKHGASKIISLGFEYGQRNFWREEDAALAFCKKYDISHRLIEIPHLGAIGGSSLTDTTVSVTTDMKEQRSTVVPQRNAILLFCAAAFAEVNDCDEIWHGACKEDYEAYRDCRPEFFELVEMTIQAGRTSPIKGSENITKDFEIFYNPFRTKQVLPIEKVDIQIITPLILEKKEDTLKRIVAKYGVEVYKDSYTCYLGGTLQCGKCSACQERKHAFEVNGLKDPVE